MLWDEHRGKLMLIDLECAEIQTRPALRHYHGESQEESLREYKDGSERG